jgi:H+-transporting ATPase
MFVVVLATVFFGFSPLTPVMIILLALLDDIPIMTIAYDNTVRSRPPCSCRSSRAATCCCS